MSDFGVFLRIREEENQKKLTMKNTINTLNPNNVHQTQNTNSLLADRTNKTK